MMIRSTLLHGGAVLLAAGLAGCATSGGGAGTTSGGQPVDFTWNSTGGAVHGTMTATVEDDGKTFSGQYFEITSETEIDDLRPLSFGWGRPFGGWPYWDDDIGPDFVTHYTGHVVANLASADGQRMRCDFQLVRPSSGMSGGGEGRCQMPGGNTIDAEFPAA